MINYTGRYTQRVVVVSMGIGGMQKYSGLLYKDQRIERMTKELGLMKYISNVDTNNPLSAKEVIINNKMIFSRVHKTIVF